jgi:hypothetical protein
VKHPRPAVLHHYTCTCAAAKIRLDDSIRPASTLVEKLTYPFLPEEIRDVAKANAGLCWFTDLEPPGNRDILGLTSLSLTCDRIACCFQVEADWRVVHWWPSVRRQHKDLWLLEDYPGTLPAHWFISEHPVKVIKEVTSGLA